jgi:hypothetical protein
MPLVEPTVVIGHEEEIFSRDMLPTLAPKSIPESGFTNAAFGSECADRDAALSVSPLHFGDQFLGEFGLALVRAMRVPPLADSIMSIVAASAQEQVSRVTTRRIVAMMQDTKPCGNRTVRQNPGGAMSWEIAPPEAECSIPLGVAGSEPRPAFFRFALADACPESFGHGTGLCEALAGKTAETRLSFQFTRPDEKRPAALLTGQLNRRFPRMVLHAGPLSSVCQGAGRLPRRRPQIVPPSFYGKGVDHSSRS